MSDGENNAGSTGSEGRGETRFPWQGNTNYHRHSIESITCNKISNYQYTIIVK